MRSKLLMYLLALAAFILLIFHYRQIGTNAVMRPTSSDFLKFYISATRLDEGKSMYWLVPAREQRGDICHPDTPIENRRFSSQSSYLALGGDLACLAPNLNPPIFMALMKPIAMLPYGYAWWTWAAFSFSCAIYGIWLLSSIFSFTLYARIEWTLLSCVALFAYYPTVANFTLAQLGLVLLAPMASAWQSLRNGRSALAGIWLGIIISIKPFFGLMLIPLWPLKQRRTLIACSGTIVTLGLVGLLIFGSEAYQDYFKVAKNINWTASNWNGSWIGFFDRYFSGQPNSNWLVDKKLSKTFGMLFAVLTILICYYFFIQSLKFSKENKSDIIFSIFLPASLLASPLGWMYYFPLFVIGFCVAWQASTHKKESRKIKLALFLPLTLSMTPVTLTIVPTPLNPTDWYGIDALQCYILIAWLGLNIYIISLPNTQTKRAPNGAL